MDAGKSPKWNQTLQIPIVSKKDLLLITCYDEDVMMDDFVGQRKFTI